MVYLRKKILILDCSILSLQITQVSMGNATLSLNEAFGRWYTGLSAQTILVIVVCPN